MTLEKDDYQKPKFEKLISSFNNTSPEIPNKTLIMMALLQLEQTNLTGRPPSYFTNIQFDNDVSDAERKVINQNLIAYF